jgi:hypothetical protein
MRAEYEAMTSQVQPFTFELNATREDDPSQSIELMVHVMHEILDKARQRGLTGEQALELAIERALQQRELDFGCTRMPSVRRVPTTNAAKKPRYRYPVTV